MSFQLHGLGAALEFNTLPFHHRYSEEVKTWEDIQSAGKTAFCRINGVAGLFKITSRKWKEKKSHCGVWENIKRIQCYEHDSSVRNKANQWKINVQVWNCLFRHLDGPRFFFSSSNSSGFVLEWTPLFQNIYNTHIHFIVDGHKSPSQYLLLIGYVLRVLSRPGHSTVYLWDD